MNVTQMRIERKEKLAELTKAYYAGETDEAQTLAERLQREYRDLPPMVADIAGPRPGWRHW